MWFTPAPTTAWATTACWWATTTSPAASSPTTAATSRGPAPPVRPLRRRLARVQPHLHPLSTRRGGPHRGRDPGPGRGRRGDVGAHPGIAQQEAGANGSDPFAWFNVGTALRPWAGRWRRWRPSTGARALRPWRMPWCQFAPLETYLVAGRLNDVLTPTGPTCSRTPIWRSRTTTGAGPCTPGQGASARSAFQAALRANPRYAPAQHTP